MKLIYYLFTNIQNCLYNKNKDINKNILYLYYNIFIINQNLFIINNNIIFIDYLININ